MPLDPNKPENAEIMRRRQLKAGKGQVIFRAGAELKDGVTRQIFRLPDQYTCKPKDFNQLRQDRREREKGESS